MKYTGKLYGKAGGMYFDTSHTTDEWDSMEARIVEIDRAIDLIQKARSNNGNDALLQDAIIALLPPKK
jgi:hypothetical protein